MVHCGAYSTVNVNVPVLTMTVATSTKSCSHNSNTIPMDFIGFFLQI